jgi:hypothetical protein
MPKILTNLGNLLSLTKIKDLIKNTSLDKLTATNNQLTVFKGNFLFIACLSGGMKVIFS